MFSTSFESLDQWTRSLEALTANIEEQYRSLRRSGCVGISWVNLFQIVGTKGVTVPPSSFARLFEQAVERADIPAGFVYGKGGAE